MIIPVVIFFFFFLVSNYVWGTMLGTKDTMTIKTGMVAVFKEEEKKQVNWQIRIIIIMDPKLFT